MDIDKLLLILEKSKGEKIQSIEEDFYARLNSRIKELENKKREVEDDRESFRIDDELKTLKRIQRKIFEVRTSKIVRAAWASVCGTETGMEGFENLTRAEKNLFDELVDSIKNFKSWAFSSELKDKKSKDESEPEYVVVRVKEDVDEFEGVNGKTYKLGKEDVITLPSLNAKVLINSGTVEVIDTQRIMRKE